MHKGRLREVKKTILESGKKGLFNMNMPGLSRGEPSWGTRGCVAGHAAWLYLTKSQAHKLYEDLGEGWLNVGAFLLDLPINDAYPLFYGEGFGGLRATAQDAAQGIDRLLARKNVGHYDGPMPTSAKLKALYQRGRN